MGGLMSSDDVGDLPSLPEQQIVNVMDSQAVAASGRAAGGAIGQFGMSKSAVAVRALLSLRRGCVRLDRGVVVVEVAASVDGLVEVLAPAMETLQEGRTWPAVALEGAGRLLRRPISASLGGHTEVRFDRPGEALPPLAAQAAVDGRRRWPLVVVLRPGQAELGRAAEDPPDGTLLACCGLQRGQLAVARQLIAWGGDGQAYEMQELYGLQEATAGEALGNEASPTAGAAVAGAPEDQKKCVVCLTEPKDTALMPCGHFCVCHDCGMSLRMVPTRSRCPLCRREVQEICKIDFDGPVPPPLAAQAPVAQPAPAAVASAAGAPPTQAPEAPPGAVRTVVVKAAPGAPAVAAAPAAAASAAGAPPTQAPGAPPGAVRTVVVKAAPGAPAVAGAPVVVAAAGALVVSGTAAPTADSQGVAGAAEAARGAAASSASSSPAPAPGGDLPPRCLRRLATELRKVEEQREQFMSEHGIDIALSDLAGNDLTTWTVRIFASGVDASSDFGRELRRVGAEAVELELWVGPEFPSAPPKVRVLRPCFQQGSFFVHAEGALCMEALTLQGWSAAMSLPQVGVQVKTMMGMGKGTIQSCAAMGQPGPAGRQRAASVATRIESVHNDWKTFKMA